MSVETVVQDSMGGLPDFEDFDLTWGKAVELSADTIERLAEE